MTRKLILIRHGNTFNPQDKPVWVGRNEDLPLVPSGMEQAQALSHAFQKRGIVPAIVYSSPLQRALTTAEGLGKKVHVLTELNEVDYGTWGGMSSDDLKKQGFEQQLHDWDTLAAIPETAGWGSTEEELEKQVRQLCSRVESFDGTGVQVAVTSNGLLKCVARFQLSVFPELCRDATLKVRTGHLCELEWIDGGWSVCSWGISPLNFQDQQESTVAPIGDEGRD